MIADRRRPDALDSAVRVGTRPVDRLARRSPGLVGRYGIGPECDVVTSRVKGAPEPRHRATRPTNRARPGVAPASRGCRRTTGSARPCAVDGTRAAERSRRADRHDTEALRREGLRGARRGPPASPPPSSATEVSPPATRRDVDAPALGGALGPRPQARRPARNPRRRPHHLHAAPPVDRTGYQPGCPPVNASATLCPPKPKASFTAALKVPLRGASATTSSSTPGSRFSRFCVAGTTP
ncbi:hypothetical protein AHOG_23335 [Actinoalloteichus hoggarensis]|uniref:Uncharacterized protein n=1 Tax=Actinoalloteichus hoggarensis TaxID=1470176 RepID=A0A221W8P2_9PSEU|nr:hypothetical protein AHOG_23335 [Actinoalloteichus hoggarensis]